MQIIIQKRYIILYEVAENIFAVFVLIVNFIFTITIEVREQAVKVKNKVRDVVVKTKNKILSFFDNYFDLNKEERKYKINFNYKIINKYKNNFVLYSNLLAPPII